MKTASIAAFLTVAASSASIGSAYERELSDERRLGEGKYSGDASSKFAKYVDIYNRCCDQTFETLDSDESPCKCPVRTPIWGIKYFFNKWENKCETKIKDKSDIIALAEANGFTELVNLLVPDRLDLVETLKSDNDGKGWTVFAPTDEAFEVLFASIPEDDPLTDTEIRKVLTYHVVADTVPASALEDEQEVITVNGATITIDLSSGVSIKDGTTDEAVVGPTDVFASNGVVHVINKVLIPPGFRA
uniref:FAS1 domain-containing protein n=1 Tax=Minutocellus polymorphus TaxID=265543 RepID=A0A7S0AQ34_9STRA|mmetsp:Transcript_19330/g.32044  ORF Transcript_19330/g.32044 Transcript_19330/m.32044 type:complete len:246 (+) Transcript_19330:147-884(+)